MKKFNLLKFVIMLFAIGMLAGCAVPVTTFNLKASCEGDSEQANTIFIQRGILNFTMVTCYPEDMFLVCLSYNEYDNHNVYQGFGSELRFDTTRIKIVDDAGKVYLPTGIYLVDSKPNWFTWQGGTKIGNKRNFILKTTSEFRFEFPLSVVELPHFQLHTGIIGDKTLATFSVVRKKGWKLPGGLKGMVP